MNDIIKLTMLLAEIAADSLKKKETEHQYQMRLELLRQHLNTQIVRKCNE